MIRQRNSFANQPIEDLIAYLDGYAEVCDEEFDAALAMVEPLLLDELHHAPPRRQWPDDYPQGRLEWTSEKQRRAYWATDGFGAGIPYQRTGNLPAAWTVEKEGGGISIGLVVRNTDPAAAFVYGSLAKTNPGRYQQQFHAITGWQQAYETVEFWLDALEEQYVANMAARLGDTLAGTVTVRQRAFTRNRSAA